MSTMASVAQTEIGAGLIESSTNLSNANSALDFHKS
jgi:hypothetical protein